MRKGVRASEVRRELLPNQSTALLHELHLLTPEGHLNADARRKLKQVNHLVGLIQPALTDLLERFGDPQLLDAGSGNAYLGLVLYELFLKGQPKGTLHCVEGRAELSERARTRAQRLGFDRIAFHTGAIAEVELPKRLHLVMALHACDTATDDALILAIRANADHVAVVPCCQAEVARQLDAAKAKTEGPMRELFEHPWHRREFGSHLTNVIRALVLEAFGYSVTVTELTGFEHSLKNELLIAKKVRGESAPARARLNALLEQTRVRPKLVRVLMGGLAETQGAPP